MEAPDDLRAQAVGLTDAAIAQALAPHAPLWPHSPQEPIVTVRLAPEVAPLILASFEAVAATGEGDGRFGALLDDLRAHPSCLSVPRAHAADTVDGLRAAAKGAREGPEGEALAKAVRHVEVVAGALEAEAAHPTGVTIGPAAREAARVPVRFELDPRALAPLRALVGLHPLPWSVDGRHLLDAEGRLVLLAEGVEVVYGEAGERMPIGELLLQLAGVAVEASVHATTEEG